MGGGERSGGRAWKRCLVGGILSLVAAVLLPLLLIAHQQHGPEPTVHPHEGPLPDGPAPIPPQAGQDLDRDGLDDAEEAAVARRHAPRYRFAGRDPRGPDIAQNTDERFFPMTVSRFLACLEAGVYRLEDGSTVRTDVPGRFEGNQVIGFPSRMAGDRLGEAAIYSHVYPADQPGEWFCQYWVFYPYDRSGATVLGLPTSLGDHRGDWEHTAYRVSLDPPGVLEGFYYGHDVCLRVPREDLELVEEEHPVVYVSQGKHASYPVACVVPTTEEPAWLIQHQDVANGLGPTWDAWKGTIIDLGELEHPRPEAADWLGFMGRWGPDGVDVFGEGLANSPTGPAGKLSWLKCDQAKNGPAVHWRDHIERRGGRVVRR